MIKLLLTATFLLISITPSFAQTQLQAFQGTLPGFGGGELPVRDETTRAQTTIAAIKTTAMLVDMLRQALLSSGLWDRGTGPLLGEIAAARTGDMEILYGQDGSGVWPEVYQFDYTPEDGTWREMKRESDRATHATLRTTMKQLEMLRADDGRDDEEIRELQDALDFADGRNQIQIAQGNLIAKGLELQRKNLQVSSTLTNAVSVIAGFVVDNEVRKQSMQEAVTTNFGQEPVLPMPRDWGL